MNDSARDPVTARLAEAALVSFAAFAAGLLLMHALRPDYALRSHMISDYAVGAWGGVMAAAFASAGLGFLLLALALARTRPASSAGWVVAGLCAIVAVGLWVTAAFPTDLPGAPSTRSGDIHEISFMVNVASLVLASVFGIVLAWRDRRWLAHRSAAAVLSALLVAALLVQFKTLHRGMPYGIANRAFVLVMTVWFCATALRLRKVGRQSG